jgi:hypothetical protein
VEYFRVFQGLFSLFELISFRRYAGILTNSDERLRLLALAALIAQSTQASGWSDEAIERLEIYRNDPSPMVAEIAQFTFVS